MKRSIVSYIQALRSGRYSLEDLHFKFMWLLETHVHKKSEQPQWFQLNNIQTKQIRL